MWLEQQVSLMPGIKAVSIIRGECIKMLCLECNVLHIRQLQNFLRGLEIIWSCAFVLLCSAVIVPQSDTPGEVHETLRFMSWLLLRPWQRTESMITISQMFKFACEMLLILKQCTFLEVDTEQKWKYKCRWLHWCLSILC